MRLSNQGRRYPQIFLGRNPHEKPLLSEGDLQTLEVNTNHHELEVLSADRLNKRHMEEVKKHMPRIRECRKNNKLIRRVPSDVLETVRVLCLV